jgi:ribonuclease HI
MINRILWHLYSKDLMSPKQYGFTPQTSTEKSLVDAINYIQQALNKKQLCFVISLDISGAFDSVWWPYLLNQLIAYKTPSNLINLVRNYFLEREAEIRFQGIRKTKLITKGCPQGSTCGPGFWLIVINDLLQQTWPANVRLQAFADDCLLIVTGSSEQEIEQITNQCLRRISDWGKKCKQTFNSNKTFSMLITRRLKYRELNVFMDGIQIQSVQSMRILGVYLDRRLNWRTHVNKIYQKAYQLITQLVRIARPTWGANSDVLRTLYRGAIEPTITYCSPVWGHVAQKKCVQIKLRQIQRLIALRICKAYKTVSTNAAVLLAGFLPLHLRIQELMDIFAVKNNLPIETISLPDGELERDIKFSTLPHPASRRSPVIIHQALDNDNYHIFTDGSKSEMGAGAAFVVFCVQRQIITRSYKLSYYCTVYQAELFAIIQALEWLGSYGLQGVRVTIFTDSLSAITAFQDINTLNPMVNQIKTLLIELEKEDIFVKFIWIRGHSGIYGNEVVDSLAKQVICSRKRTECHFIPFSYIKRMLKEFYTNVWDKEYQETEQGMTTKQFFTSVHEFLKVQHKITTNFITTQFYTGHGKFKHYLYRFKLVNDQMCSCNRGIQTIDHLLLHCELMDEITNQIKERAALLKLQWPIELNVFVKDEKLLNLFPYFVKIIYDKL